MKHQDLPLVTVGTLCYNTGKYVVEALECVKRQNYNNIQHIIIDDCSSDNSAELVQQWIDKNSYDCQFIKRPENKGVHYGLTEILNLAKGKYLSMISDDLWSDDKLVEQVEAFEKLDDTYAMVYGDTNMIDESGKVIIPSMFTNYKGENFSPPSGYIFRDIVFDFYFFIQAATISISHFKDINYVFNREIISEDWDWQLALSKKYRFYGINKVYAKYRWLETSITRTNWTDERRHNVWLSHAKMMMKYYNHLSHSRNDNLHIYLRVLRIYRELCSMPSFGRRKKIKFLFDLLIQTKKVRLAFGLMSIALSLPDHFTMKTVCLKFG